MNDVLASVAPRLDAPLHDAQTVAQAARAAQAAWAATPLRARLALIGRFRRALARDPWPLVDAVPPPRLPAETLAAEILPLAEAARFLEREAAGLLAPRALRGGRPLWLWGVRACVRRDPVGVVLILAPSNYPVMLPGVQALQALAAGNAVLLKPAPEGAEAARALASLLEAQGLPAGVLTVLNASAASGAAAVEAGVDRVVLTGSAATGRRVLAAAAPSLTPVTAELSGCDAMFVLDGADLELVAECIAYGLALNGGATCIAPRRVFHPPKDAARLEALVLARSERIAPRALSASTGALVAGVLADAVAGGARVSGRPGTAMVIAGATTAMRAAREDVFAPIVSLLSVDGPEAALAAAASCPYALGASVFGPPRAAEAFALRVRAGSVVVNDVIVPTADPRLPFGGRGASGFGVTRGAEGLLEMTVVKAVSSRRGRFRPHLAQPAPDEAARMAALLDVAHGGRPPRLAALRALVARPRS